jgi:hypothetical protein
MTTDYCCFIEGLVSIWTAPIKEARSEHKEVEELEFTLESALTWSVLKLSVKQT